MRKKEQRDHWVGRVSADFVVKHKFWRRPAMEISLQVQRPVCCSRTIFSDRPHFKIKPFLGFLPRTTTQSSQVISPLNLNLYLFIYNVWDWAYPYPFLIKLKWFCSGFLNYWLTVLLNDELLFVGVCNYVLRLLVFLN